MMGGLAKNNVMEEGLKALALSVSDEQKKAWEKHLELLLKWNKTYNLTAITTLEEAIRLHLLDSLSIAPYLNASEIMDVGTGGGFPGIPLAILFPEKQFTLVDASAKKIRFLKQVVLTLGLKNVTAIHGRIEAIEVENKPDCIVSRAFSSLELFTSFTQKHLVKDGLWLAMKGKLPDNELSTLGSRYDIKIDLLNVPGVEADRHLITIKSSS